MRLKIITFFISWVLCPTPVFSAAPAIAAERATSPAVSLWGLTNLWTLHLTISPTSWKGLFEGNGGDQPKGDDGIRIFGFPFGGDGQGMGRFSKGEYPWSTATLEFAGQKMTNVALRFKGASSFVRAPNGYKRPFKIDMNRGFKGRKFMDAKEFYLNNNVNDATQMREALAYDLFRRAGIPAPRTAFASVFLTIPGRIERQPLGLYTIVEPVDTDFLNRHFKTKEGLLLKPEMMAGIEYHGSQWKNYESRYHPKTEVTPEDAKRFVAFARFISEGEDEAFAARLSEFVDVTALTKFVALNAILANADSFLGNGHNYFLYLNSKDGHAQFIPWDLNESFGMHPVSGPSGIQMKSSVLRPNADPNRLVERLVEDSKTSALYRAQVGAMLTNLFEPKRLGAEIDRIASVTGPVVLKESKRAKLDFERTILETKKPDEGDTSQPRFDSGLPKDNYRPRGFPPAIDVDNLPLKQWINGRAIEVRKQLDGKSRGKRPRARLEQ